MTIREISNQLCDISVHHRVNGLTRRKLETFLRHRMEHSDRVLMRAEAPDGAWYVLIGRFGNRRDEYDYTIPDNREAEKRMLDRLVEY